MLTVNNADTYVAWGMQFTDPTEANVATPIGVTGNLSNLQVLLTVAPGGGNTWKFTVDKNGVATGLSCTISNGATTCSDGSTVSVVSSDTIDLDVTPTVGTPSTPTHISWSANVTP
jgi:hypothetical protein